MHVLVLNILYYNMVFFKGLCVQYPFVSYVQSYFFNMTCLENEKIVTLLRCHKVNNMAYCPNLFIIIPRYFMPWEVTEDKLVEMVQPEICCTSCVNKS